MKKYKKSFFLLIILIIVTFYYLFKNINLKELIKILNNVEIIYIMISFLLFFSYLFFEALSLNSLLKKINYKKSIFTNLKYAFVDFYFCSITPSAIGGQPMDVYYMNKDNIPLKKSTPILLINSIMFRLVLILYGILAIILRYYYLNKTTIIFLIVGFIINILFILIFLSSLIFKKFTYRTGYIIIKILYFFHILKKENSYLEKLESSILEFQEGYKFIKGDFFLLIKLFLFNFIQRGCLFLISYMVYRSFGFDNDNFISLMAIQILVSLSVDSLPIPGGVGLQEYLLSLLLINVYSENYMMPSLLMNRFLTYYLSLIFSSITLLMNYIIMNKRKEEFV